MNPAELLERVCAGVEDPRPVPAAAIIVAHPDDEVVGAGARLPRVRDAILVHVTDGAPRDLCDAIAAGFATRRDYARARRRELNAALLLAGIAPEQARELGCVDQEAALNLVDLSCRVAEMLRDLRPELVLTHPYEGGHPDHDATAFAVHAACRLLQEQNLTPPAVIEMTFYHNCAGAMATAEFLPYSGYETTTLALSEEERGFKRRLIDCYATQWNTLCQFPIEVERFRPAPRYDFTRPPHAGQLFYECFPWGMTGAHFTNLAHVALDALGMAGAL